MNDNRVEMVTINFYNWLVDKGYREKEDFTEDINDMTDDFKTIKEKAPRLFNLLKDISS